MSRSTLVLCRLRTGLIAVLALYLMVGMGGTRPVFADPASPLSVTVVASPSPVPSGAEITYSISIVNTGGAAVSNIVVTDQINGVGGIGTPPQLALVTTVGTCSQTNLKVTCNLGTLAGRASATIMIRGIVTAAAGETLNNTVSATGTKSSQNFTTSATVQTLVQGGGGGSLADLSISKTGPSSVVQSALLVYVLTVNNTGTANATNVRVVDTLPAGVTLNSVDSTSLFVCTSAGSPVTITCDGGAVNQGANATITINATAPATTGNIANTAIVDPNNTIPESNELNNSSATIGTAVTSGPATQTLTVSIVDAPDPVVPGALLKYTIVVTNIATRRANDVVVVNGTQGLEAASITASQVIVKGSVGNGGGCVVSASQVTCSIRTLDPGGTQTVTIEGQVIASAGSTIFNTAVATGNVNNVGYRVTAMAQTVVKPAVDLTITKADTPDPVCARSWPGNPPGAGTHLLLPPDGLAPAGGSVPVDPPGLLASPVCLGGLTYHFVIGNSGTQEASNVVVRDPLPTGLIFDSYETNGGFVCAVDGANVITCSGGTIPAESTRTLAFLLVAPPNVGEIINTVTVDPNNALYESDETNNTFVQNTTIATGVDLVIRKDDRPIDPPGAQVVTEGFDPVATSGTMTYVVTVDNVGTQNVTGIRVRDTLPADTRFLSVTADPDHGFTCAHNGAATGGIVECVGGHLLGTMSEFYDPAGPAGAGPGDDIATIKIVLFARPTLGVMHNEVRVDPLNEIAEVNELNNLDTEETTAVNGGAAFSAFNELSIVKTQVSPAGAAVATNGTLIYLLTITNDATDPAINIRVRDFLPTGSRFIEAVDTVPGPDAFNCTHAAGVVECVGGTLDGTHDLLGAAIGQSRAIRITVFAPNTPGDYSNQSIVDPNNAIPEGNEFNNNSAIVTQVRTVGDGGQNAFNELTINKSQVAPAGGTVATSSIVTYDIVVSNVGSDPAFNVAVRDTLPEGFTFISAIDTVQIAQSFVCALQSGNVISCTGATLSGTVNTASGLPTSRTIRIMAFASAVPGGYTNTAIVDPDNVIAEGDETNNMAQASTTVVVGAGYIDLTIKKCDEPVSGLASTCDTDTPKTFNTNGEISYHLHVENLGTNPAFNVVVQDTLPAGTIFVSATDESPSPGDFICTQNSGVVTCTGATIDGTSDLVPGLGTSREIKIVVKAPNQHNITITNQAFVDPTNAIPESNEINNQSSETSAILSPVNLTLDKEGPDTAHQNDTDEYVLTVKNLGTAGATGVVVRDPLPVGLIPLGVLASPSNFSCQVLENPVNVVECVGDMGAAGSGTDEVTITINVFVTQNGGSMDNEACVDPGNLIVESNESDNCNTKSTQVVKFSPDLFVNKTASKPSVSPGEFLDYTITVQNDGDAAAQPVDITDVLPVASVDYQSSIASNGFTCTFASPNVTCNRATGLAPGEFTEIKIQVKVKENATGTFANTVSVPNNTPVDTSVAPCDIDPSQCANEAAADTTSSNSDNSETVVTSVGASGIDLVLTNLIDTPDPTAPGGIVTYEAHVSNVGTANASGVVVRTTLAPDAGLTLTHISSAGSNGFICTFAVFVECTGNLPAGETTIIKMFFSVSGTVPPDKTVTVTTKVDPDGNFGEFDETNNELSTTTTVHANCTGCIDLVTSTVLGTPNPVAKNGVVKFTVGVGNAGDTPSGAFQIRLTASDAGDIDFEPGGFDASQPSDDYTASNEFDCTASGMVVTCEDGGGTPGLQPGEGVLITLNVHVKSATSNPAVSLEVLADSGNSVSEFSESNNLQNGGVSIAP